MIALEDLNPWFKTRFTLVRIIVLWLKTISNTYLKNVNTYIEKYNNLQFRTLIRLIIELLSKKHNYHKNSTFYFKI